MVTHMFASACVCVWVCLRLGATRENPSGPCLLCHFPCFAPLVVGFLCLLVLLLYDGRFAVKQALSRSLTLSSSLANANTTAKSTLPSFSFCLLLNPLQIAGGKLTIIARRLCLICFQGLLFFATTWKLITIVHKAIFPCSNVARHTAHISIISFSKV